MQLISVNVGLPREVPWNNITISTGIYKKPVPGDIAVRKLNLDGDRQADLTVHGGPWKAVYAYPAEQMQHQPIRYVLMSESGPGPVDWKWRAGVPWSAAA